VCYDSDAPSCFSSVKRKARKAHNCFECGRKIQPGDVYEYASGIWDRKPDDFKTCEACAILRDHVREEEGCNESPPFGMLLGAARESVLADHPHLDDEGE
jgi:hypothetical protein